MERKSSVYVFDACSLLNLNASRRFIEIASATPARFIAAEQTAGEVLYLRRGGDGADQDERELVDLRAPQERGILTVVSLESPAEVAYFVDFAFEMDDGEAASCALAVHRGGALVSDDRKARRIIAQRHAQMRLLTTSEVIKAWVDRTRPNIVEVAGLLLDVEERASFRPGHFDPLESWWRSVRNKL